MNPAIQATPVTMPPMQSKREHWRGLCESIGGEEAVLARLGELIHEQRSAPAGPSPACDECNRRASEFFEAAAEAEWWPLGYGIFKMLSDLMGCTEYERMYAPKDEE